MKQFVFIILLVCASLYANSQNERKFVRKGNDFFMDAVKDTTKLDTIQFSKAETEYRKALEKRPEDIKWNFNLGDALYKQMKFEESISSFDKVAEQTENPVEKARAYHNKGNSLLFNKKLDESIESYKEALRNNPGDIETKYNLAYAQNMKKKQEEQQKKQDKNKDKDQDKKEDQDKDQQNKDNQNKNKDQNQDKKDQKDQQNKDQQNKDQKKQQQQPNKISKENAQQLLQALQNDEKKIQDKVKKAKAAKAKKVKTEKDW